MKRRKYFPRISLFSRSGSALYEGYKVNSRVWKRGNSGWANKAETITKHPVSGFELTPKSSSVTLRVCTRWYRLWLVALLLSLNPSAPHTGFTFSFYGYLDQMGLSCILLKLCQNSKMRFSGPNEKFIWSDAHEGIDKQLVTRASGFD